MPDTTAPAPFDLAARAAAAPHEAPADVPSEPSQRVTILTCMDSRVLPQTILGLEPGEVHVLRNAGARVTDDVMRSLLLSTWALGSRHVALMPHSRCGAAYTDDVLASVLEDAGATGPFGTLHGAADQIVALRADLEQLRADSRLPADVVITAHRYDVDTGRVVPLDELEAEQAADA